MRVMEVDLNALNVPNCRRNAHALNIYINKGIINPLLINTDSL